MSKLEKRKLNNLHISTRAIHAGNAPDKETGAIIPPIFQTSTFVQTAPGEHLGYEYSRSHNPTRTRLEECLASLEKGKHAIVTASGLSAMMLIMHALPNGSTIVSGDDIYGGSYRLFTTVFHERHKFIFIDTTDTEKLAATLKKYKPALLWLESPTNPMLKITDIKKATSLAQKTKTLTVVDNTFMSPVFQNPIELGADIVVHSMTKYINGHSDIIGGAIILNDTPLYKSLWKLQNSIGPSQSPFDSWLVIRGLKTLGVRMKAHHENAMKIAKFLENHKKVSSVIYPGLASHPQHAIAKKQMSGFSGMITFYIKGDLKESKVFLESLNLFALAESLGGAESLVEHPAIMTHASVPQDIRKKLGIHNNLVRLSVGIEDADDLINDLAQALRKV
jgi:cystathionine gamma-lyase